MDGRERGTSVTNGVGWEVVQFSGGNKLFGWFVVFEFGLGCSGVDSDEEQVNGAGTEMNMNGMFHQNSPYAYHCQPLLTCHICRPKISA
jgi:hypothetical protein